MRRFGLSAAVLILLLATLRVPAQENAGVNPNLFSEMKWRSIGPHRASRTRAAAGHRSQPFTFYTGAVNGGVWKTTDAGRTWTPIFDDQPTGSIGIVVVAPSDANTVYVGSGEGLHRPDLSTGDGVTRATYELPKSIGKYLDQESARATQRGVIYTVAPSYKDINRIWAGTDDGLIHTTADGGVTWRDVTPAALTPWAKVSIIDAGRFDPLTAYAAINTIRLDDLRPHIFKTHDAGKSWTEIVAGFPNGETVNAVREDPKKKGLLFDSTERAVYFSIDDGGHWQSLRLNMPATSVRDIIVKDDDLVAATHGRGFWILEYSDF